MFKDARQLDTQRTAASFDKGRERYAETAESWFNGSVGSVDKRLAACDKLIHNARFTVARLPTSDAQRYLEAAEDLSSDRRALLALRDDLLNGASNREDVSGPPGWRPRQADAGYENRMPNPPSTMNEALKPVYQNAIDAGEDPIAAVQLHMGSRKYAHWFKDDGSYIVPNDGGPHPRDYSSPQEYIQARNLHNYISDASQKNPGAGDVAVDESWRSPMDPGPTEGPQPLKNPIGQAPYRERSGAHEPQWDDAAGDWAVPTMEEDMTGQVGAGFEPVRPIGGSLTPSDQRWVTLESAKFVAANRDTLDDGHELATRAHNYAALKTSTFTPQRSATVCEAFVEAVSDLGQRTAAHRPVRVASAPALDFDDQAMYLL